MRPWSGAAVSLIMHLAVVVVFVLSARAGSHVVPRSGGSTVPVQPVSMVYLPPPTQRRIDQPISRPPPDAIQAQDDRAAQIRERTPDLPPVAEPEAAPAPEEKVEAKPEDMATTPPEPPADSPTLESEAKRIFGRPRLQTQPENNSQMGARLGNLADRDTPAHRSCVPKPRDPHAQVEMAEVIGRVYYDEARRRPLPGAFLQMIGTPYSTYSDNSGRYRLVFDASLVDECRTQYVRVVAAGYTGKNLVLGLGPGINDIVMGR